VFHAPNILRPNFLKNFHAKKILPARLTCTKCEWRSHKHFRWVRGLNLESLKCHFLDFGGKTLQNSDDQKTLVKLVKLSITHGNSCYIVSHMNILGSKVNNKIRSILVLIVIPKTVPFLHSASGHDFPSMTHHMPVEQGGGGNCVCK
jgi:hypothetical protein